MSIRFDLTDLRLFIHIVDSGSITAGANASNLSLAAASGRVLGMEQALGSPLLVRGRRGVTNTAAGLTLEKHSRKVIALADRLKTTLEEFAQSEKNFVTIVSTSAVIREYLPDTLGDFLSSHSHINVTVTEAVGDDAIQAVLAGVADIAFVTDRTSVQGLEAFPFVMNQFALIVPIGHSLVKTSNGNPISIISGDTFDIVGLNEGSALQDSWERRAGDRGVRLKYRVRVPSFDAQLRLVEHGVGIAMLPEATARRAARTMAIEVLPLSDSYLVRRLLLCTRRLNDLSPDLQQLVKMLLKLNKGENLD